jgi:DNA-binding transcriptional MocR family regulator
LAEHYKQRRDFFIGELEKIQDKGIYWQVPSGGLLLWCSLDEKIKEKQLYHLAKDRGLIVMPGFLFYPYGYHGCGHVRLCFGKGSDEEMCRGIEILGQCLDECIKERI